MRSAPPDATSVGRYAAWPLDPIPPFGSDHLTYRRAGGLNGDAIRWSVPASIVFSRETLETDDGEIDLRTCGKIRFAEQGRS